MSTCMGNMKIIKIVRDLIWINMVHFTLTQMVQLYVQNEQASE